jgi:hypothetical protein
VGVAGIAKNPQNVPNVVANELICASFGRVLLLPIPPGFIIDHNGPCYVSLNFNLAGQDLPPADAVALLAQHPRLCTGIILFDVWMLNSDRHTQNLAFDKSTNKCQIFDHSHAFFQNPGRQHLESQKGQIGIANHCLASEATALEGFEEWIARIQAIPKFYIVEIVAAAVDVGLPAADKDYCAEFILDRRTRIKELIVAHKAHFPKIEQATWNTLTGQGGPP